MQEKARAENLVADARQALKEDTPTDRLRILTDELKQVYQSLATAGSGAPSGGPGPQSGPGPVPGTDRQAHRAGPGTMFRGLTTGILPGPAVGRIPRSARPRRDY